MGDHANDALEVVIKEQELLQDHNQGRCDPDWCPFCEDETIIDYKSTPKEIPKNSVTE